MSANNCMLFALLAASLFMIKKRSKLAILLHWSRLYSCINREYKLSCAFVSINITYN